jgi:ribosome-associated protein
MVKGSFKKAFNKGSCCRRFYRTYYWRYNAVFPNFVDLKFMFDKRKEITDMTDVLQDRDFSAEFIFSTSRSSGPGGQNVNKVNSKVELRFPVDLSQLLSDREKQIILNKLKNRINNEGELIITVQTDRSQLKNKEEAIDKFLAFIIKALTPRKPRRATRPTKASVEKRLETKKQISEKKAQRNYPPTP